MNNFNQCPIWQDAYQLPNWIKVWWAHSTSAICWVRLFSRKNMLPTGIHMYCLPPSQEREYNLQLYRTLYYLFWVSFFFFTQFPLRNLQQSVSKQRLNIYHPCFTDALSYRNKILMQMNLLCCKVNAIQEALNIQFVFQDWSTLLLIHNKFPVDRQNT